MWGLCLPPSLHYITFESEQDCSKTSNLFSYCHCASAVAPRNLNYGPVSFFLPMLPIIDRHCCLLWSCGLHPIYRLWSHLGKILDPPLMKAALHIWCHGYNNLHMMISTKSTIVNFAIHRTSWPVISCQVIAYYFTGVCCIYCQMLRRFLRLK